MLCRYNSALETHRLLRQVLATIKRGSALKKRLAFALLAVSGAFVRARRVVEGVALQYAHAPRPALAYLLAAATAALLWPLHQCARGPICQSTRPVVRSRTSV
jgi:hypothetical protein